MISLKLAQHAARGGVFAVAAISCGSTSPGSKALPPDLSTVPWLQSLHRLLLVLSLATFTAAVAGSRRWSF